MMALDHATLVKGVLASYTILGVSSGWVVVKIGAGKNWARVSVLLGLILEGIWLACPPYHGYVDLLTALPDFGLEGYALFLLYTYPGKTWFKDR